MRFMTGYLFPVRTLKANNQVIVTFAWVVTVHLRW